MQTNVEKSQHIIEDLVFYLNLKYQLASVTDFLLQYVSPWIEHIKIKEIFALYHRLKTNQSKIILFHNKWKTNIFLIGKANMNHVRIHVFKYFKTVIIASKTFAFYFRTFTSNWH